MVAALYVEAGGVYYGLDDVDPWDEARDARLYDGPWPVVAHPPCARWSKLAPVSQAKYGLRIGADGGTFAAALRAVRTFDGVLEHPAYSFAWRRFDLPRPIRGRWTATLLDPGWTCEIDQHAYGFPTGKPTWLYYVGEVAPFDLDWKRSGLSGVCSTFGGGWPSQRGLRSRTPEALRDVLISLAAPRSPEPLLR